MRWRSLRLIQNVGIKREVLSLFINSNPRPARVKPLQKIQRNICRQASEVVTHSYDANDTSFINIVFLRFAPNIYIYQSIYTFIYSPK